MTFKSFKKKIRTALACREIQKRKTAPFGKPHGLDQQVIVSVTSYPARFPMLHWTLRSLLRQSMVADQTILWVSETDYLLLPPEVLELKSEGLSIRTYKHDFRSYRKIIPVLQNFPDVYIVTADDDVPYWKTWLEELVVEMKNTHPASVCHRAHRITLDQDSKPKKYTEWDKAISTSASGPLIFPTGVHGVMYDTRKLDRKVTNSDSFLSLAPSADDVWLYWMVRLANGFSVKVDGNRRVLEWPETQAQNLRRGNIQGGGNDVAVGNMIETFGFSSLG
jgi:hypothetical protein